MGDRNAGRIAAHRTRPAVCAARTAQDQAARTGPRRDGVEIMTMAQALRPFRDYAARHFRFAVDADGKMATITLDRPARKNPLTFESYAELRDLFRDLVYANDVKAVVVTGAGGNFSSGGDV